VRRVDNPDRYGSSVHRSQRLVFHTQEDRASGLCDLVGRVHSHYRRVSPTRPEDMVFLGCDAGMSGRRLPSYQQPRSLHLYRDRDRPPRPFPPMRRGPTGGRGGEGGRRRSETSSCVAARPREPTGRSGARTSRSGRFLWLASRRPRAARTQGGSDRRFN